jgi:hypothetical protein
MRLKLHLDESVFGSTSKLWIEAPDLIKISDFQEYLADYLGINHSLDIFIQDFYLHPFLSFSEMIQDSVLLVVKKVEVFQKNEKIVIKKKKILKSKEKFDERKEKFDESQEKSDESQERFYGNEREMRGVNEFKGFRGNYEKNYGKTQGQRTLYNRNGDVVSVAPIENQLKILNPIEEFEEKKKEWKIKPIPERKPKVFNCPQLITKKDEVLQFEQLSTGLLISFSLKGNPKVMVKII